jgi:hypothetical protein
MPGLRIKGGTRSQLNAAAAADQLAEREPYFISDEGRLAVGTGVGGYSAMAKEGEVASQTGDLAFSVDPTRYGLPDWLRCDGALLDNATAPASLQGYMARAADMDYTYDGPVDVLPAVPTNVFDMLGDYAIVQHTASPFMVPMRRTPGGTYSYARESFAANPAAALKCAALGVLDGVTRVLAFTTAAGGAFYAKATLANWPIYSVAATFAGKTVAGVGFGADGKFYLLSSTAPYLHSIGADVQNDPLEDVGGPHSGGVGLAMSPNQKYMVTWHSTTPFIHVFEFDGVKYVPIGSPPTGAASFLRVEVSDTGVIVGKATSASAYLICSVTPGGGVSGMTSSTVNTATAWGLSPDGRYLVSWLSNVMSYYPIVNNTIGAATAFSLYTAANGVTIAGRIGMIPGYFLASSNNGNLGYLMAGTTTPTGWIAPRIKYGFMKT